VSLLAFLCGISMILAAMTLPTKASQEKVNQKSEPEDDDDFEDDENLEYDPHVAVMMWLKSRADFAEQNYFNEPWKHYEEGTGHNDFMYQNGFYFAKRYLRLLTGYNGNINLMASAEDDTQPKPPPENFEPRIVASTDIPKGELLVSVPENSFVFKRLKPSYKLLHTCDVASKLLNSKTYRYPDNPDEQKRLPTVTKYVRPFLDSILSLHEHSDSIVPEIRDRHLWSASQLESLSNILGNELDPKANILGLWAKKEDGSDDNEYNLCRPPNTRNKDAMKIIDHFYNSSNPRGEEFKELFESTIASVVTRGWDNRMVPIYHWIPRSDDFNVVHSETKQNETEATDIYFLKKGQFSDAPFAIYQLHASRDIKKGETIILPYRSIAQKFAIEGKIGRALDDETEETSYRFWTHTLHDQWGHDYSYQGQSADPYADFLSWDYYPKTQAIEWVHKSEDESETTEQTLRSTQRNVLQAQYLRLRSMEKEVQELLTIEPNDVGNRAIVEYYELWVESLGILLASARPNREYKDLPQCLAGGIEDSSQSCASLSTPTSTSAYDSLMEPYDGDPIEYNRHIASHFCTNLFTQTIYEESKTPYAFLEWSRSYIGGGSIRDHSGNSDLEDADEREQDTCLHLENVLHSCLAFRPHVHETLIHYPASFLPKNGMKRVLYVGGGDLVLLYELLRYKSVELVIGMEIDQTVLRHSFRHYGIQPKFEDERVHWWFGDAAKSLTLLPPEEYFGTFDMVLIDLVTEIFDGLRVGDHNERLVDYMAKLLKPEGILVRQEDYPQHNTVDFAKYTVDLNLFGMPHTCSQYFTMASNTVDFANHERVDHELEDLVIYEPNIGSNNHTMMWGEYRNNLNPPERICEENGNKSAQVLPSKGLLVAIEAEDLSMDLGDLASLQTAVTKALEDLEFSDIIRHDIVVDRPLFSSMLFMFEEGYLAIRSFPQHEYSSMDLQLWNDISKREIAISTLVGAIGGDSSSESTSTFLITTGGMLGTSNINTHSTPIVPSIWCEKEDDGTPEEEKSTNENTVPTFSGIDVVMKEMASNFIGDGDNIVVVLCPNDSIRCRALDYMDFGRVVTFRACPSITNGDESHLEKCEEKMRETITTATNNSEKIRAIVMDSEAPRELGQITTKLFVNDASSYQWLSHDYLVLAPSSTRTGFHSSWRYQMLERFRTDLVEFNPVYHATVTFRSKTSITSKWTVGLLSAGNVRFYGHLLDSLDVIRNSQQEDGTLLFNDVALVETKTGAITHIPDYQPNKWATHSDYDLEPAKQQYSEQVPVGSQLLVQHEMVPDSPHDIQVGDRVLFHREEERTWYGVSSLQHLVF